MMTKFMYENIFGKRAVDTGGRLIVEDPAAAVCFLVDENLQEVVRRGRRDIAHAVIVERQHVALRIEDVVLHAGRGAPIVARARPMHSALRLDEIERAHIEITLAALE